MTAYLLDHEGRLEPEPGRERIEAKLADGSFFWLDLHGLGSDEVALLREAFRFHPLAIEDSEQFNQRPKIEEYGDVNFLVFYGAAPPPDEDRLVEVHCFYSERFLVTVRRDESPATDDVRQHYAGLPAKPVRPIVLLYRLLDALVDSFFPSLDDVDARLQGLESTLLSGLEEQQMEEVFTLRRRLVDLRRSVAPLRDLVGQLSGGIRELPGLDDEARRYFRDVYDHLIRITEQVDMERDLLTGALDVFLSNASNRLNVTTKQLAVIATIFLPLTFITGFFGQNFRWMTSHVGGLGTFLLLGVGLQLLTLALLLVFFKRRGWY